MRLSMIIAVILSGVISLWAIGGAIVYFFGTDPTVTLLAIMFGAVVVLGGITAYDQHKYSDYTENE